MWLLLLLILLCKLINSERKVYFRIDQLVTLPINFRYCRCMMKPLKLKMSKELRQKCPWLLFSQDYILTGTLYVRDGKSTLDLVHTIQILVLTICCWWWCYFTYFWDMVLVHSSTWPWTCNMVKADLKMSSSGITGMTNHTQISSINHF